MAIYRWLPGITIHKISLNAQFDNTVTHAKTHIFNP
jgi:hypothetical protein